MKLTRPDSWATVSISVSVHGRERLLDWARDEERSVVDIVDALIAAEERRRSRANPADVYRPDDWDLASLADDPEVARERLLLGFIAPQVSRRPGE